MGISHPVHTYTPPHVNLQCDICFKCVHVPRELLAHVQSHGHPIGHLLSSYRSRSPRESVVELASAASYVPESLAPSRDTSVFDDASYASSRVIAAEIHSPPRSHLHSHWLSQLKSRRYVRLFPPLCRLHSRRSQSSLLHLHVAMT